jgi:hypothetical protein
MKCRLANHDAVNENRGSANGFPMPRRGFMRRSHGFFVFVLLVAIIAFAWWRGWFSFNKENIQQDEQRAKDAIKEGADKVQEGVDKIKGNPKDSK